jgi:hypothetical protein
MCAKYSAEWWEKIPDTSREISPGHIPSSVIDDLIQATASEKPSPTRGSKTSRSGLTPIRELNAAHDSP